MGFLLRIKDVDQWITSYEPIVNTKNPDAGWSTGEDDGIMFETYGDDLETVQAAPTHNVWTWVDSEKGTLVVEGMRAVNRIGYFITKNPWVIGLDYEVFVDEYGDV